MYLTTICLKVLLPVCGIHHCHQQPSMSNLPEYSCEANCFVADRSSTSKSGCLLDWQSKPHQPHVGQCNSPLLSMSTSHDIASCVIQRHRSSDIRSERGGRRTFAFRSLSNWVNWDNENGFEFREEDCRWTQVDVGGRRWTQVD